MRLPVIGMVCYPGQGGSGVVATELGLHLARRGFEVHFIASEMPLRLRRYRRNVFFHRVDLVDYPVFQHPPYTLALAATIHAVAVRHGLDLVHAHYALPHAAAALLARDMGGGRTRVVTTLHGTDITIVGQQPAMVDLTRHLVERSDAVTAVSRRLARETEQVFAPRRAITVIPNFVDPRRFRPDAALPRDEFARPDEALLLHASNLRPVKNVAAVVRVLAGVHAHRPARLLLVGEGPQREEARRLAETLDVADRITWLGEVERLEELLGAADLLLLPSWHESFGLVALEAMACGTPALATTAGGTAEFIDDGQTGLLRDPDDVPGMVTAATALLDDPERLRRMGEDARRAAVSRFGADCVVRQYLDLYDTLLDGGSGTGGGAPV